jgi:DNA segregation ATPase FtsK/SpoIIIE, S-DNA-T family
MKNFDRRNNKKNSKIKDKIINIKTIKSIKNNDDKYKSIFLFILFFLVSIFLFYFIYYPDKSGIFGSFFHSKFNYIFGKSLYLFPLYTFLFSLNLLFKSKIEKITKNNNNKKLYYKLSLFSFLLMFIFVAVIFEATFKNENGGAVGVFLFDILKNFIGNFGVFLISVLFILVSGYILCFDLFLYIGSLFSYSSKIKNEIKEDSVKNNEILKNSQDKINIQTVEEDEENSSFLSKIKDSLDFLFSFGQNENDKKLETIGILKQFEELENIKEEEKEKKLQEKKIEIVKKEEKNNDKTQYVLPPVDLLDKPKNSNIAKVSDKELKDTANILQQTLVNFGVDAKIVGIVPGPVITRYELELAPGVKVSTIISLKNDICIAMKTQNVMIIAPIPGKSAIGIEIPNQNKEAVLFREFIESSDFKNNKMLLPFALGKTVSGKIYVTDIAKTPHLLIAGSTGSGKSVCVNSLIMSILYSKTPHEVKFIMVDPKVVELSYYKEIPHLYHPVITNPKEASKVLGQIVLEMEQRYQKFAEEGVRNIESFNEKMKSEKREQEFYLIVIIDELADLMLVASKDVEESIVRLTQKARAVGIHVVLATQRPSVDVITGIIKANLPSRISFQVISKMDSRVILDTNGAEDLLGKGDMLFLENGSSKPIRLQGAFLSEKEVPRVIDFIKKQLNPDFSRFSKTIEKAETEKIDEKLEEELKKGLNFVLERQKVSYDLLRANGFSGPKATNLISIMEMKGFIKKPAGAQKWEINFDEIEDYLNSK